MRCLGRIGGCSFGILVVLALIAAALYFFGLSRLDTLLADAVRREYMLPPSSEVIITRGSLLDTLEGEVKRFSVDSAEAKLDGLLVSDFEFRAEGIRFDLPRTFLTGQAELTEVANGEMRMKVTEKSLEDRWAGELAGKGLSDVQVQLTPDKVNITAQFDLKVTQVKVGATGELYVDGSDRIKLRAGELQLGGATIPLDRFKAVFSQLTPVVDLGRFKMSVAVDELRPADGYLIIAAHSISLEEKMALDAKRRAEEARKQKSGGAEEKSGGAASVNDDQAQAKDGHGDADTEHPADE